MTNLQRFLAAASVALLAGRAPLAQSTDIAIERGAQKGSISVASFERILKESPARLTIIDVREQKKFTQGTIQGAINIPVGQLEKRMGELPKDKPIVFICPTGARSGEAYDTVKMLGGKDIAAYFLEADVSFATDNQYTIKPH